MARTNFDATFDPSTLAKGRFIVSPYEVMQDPRVHDTAYRVFMALASFSKPSGAPVRVSTPTLSKLLRKSRQVITRCLRELEELGYIRTEGTGGRSRVTHFPHKDLYKRAALAAKKGKLSDLSEFNDRTVDVPANWAELPENEAGIDSEIDQNTIEIDDEIDQNGVEMRHEIGQSIVKNPPTCSVYLATQGGQNRVKNGLESVLIPNTPLYTMNSEAITYGDYVSYGDLHGDNRSALVPMPAAVSPRIDARFSTEDEARASVADSAEVSLRTSLQTNPGETVNGVDRSMASILAAIAELSTSVSELKGSVAGAGAVPVSAASVSATGPASHVRVHEGVQAHVGADACVQAPQTGSEAVSDQKSGSDANSGGRIEQECPQDSREGVATASKGVGEGDSIGEGKKTLYGPEIASEAKPDVPTFDCAGPVKTYTPTAEEVERWRKAFPGVDVRQALYRAYAWVDADPARRKTARGMKRFLLAWMSRDQDRGTYRNSLANRNNPGKNADGSPRRLSGNLMDAGYGGESLTAWLERAVPGGGVIDGEI